MFKITQLACKLIDSLIECMEWLVIGSSELHRLNTYKAG